MVNKETTSLNKNATNHVRVQNNNSLTVAGKNGKQIISITFVATTASYVDELQLFLESAGYTSTPDGLEVTIKVDSLESVMLVNTSQKVARIASIKVVYVDAPAVAEKSDPKIQRAARSGCVISGKTHESRSL